MTRAISKPTIPPAPAEVSAESPQGTLYSVRDVARLFDVQESRLRYWAQTGFIRPSQRVGERTFYDFRDLIAVKVARELLGAGLSLQRVRRALDALRTKLPEVSAPLSRLRIRCEHDAVIVEESERTFEASTGQVLLGFSVESLQQEAASVLAFPVAPAAADGDGSPYDDDESAYEWFLRGSEHEAAWDGEDPGDPTLEAARAAYERALELDPALAPAYTNLGALLAAQGDLDGARDCFDQALAFDSEQPEARANLASLALQTGDPETAIAGYRQLLRQVPDSLEAHYGLGRAYLEVGVKAQALAHLARFCDAFDRLAEGERDPSLRQRRAHAGAAAEALRRELRG
ncbi:MAG: tetratricopeptide repeat protein [Nannocystaceae bacterium]